MGTDVMQGTIISRRMLEAALVRIAAHWDLSGSNAASYTALGSIEGLAHELAHTLDLGPDFEVSIRTMEASESNGHEAAALRIEAAALARLGVHLSMRRLRASGNWDDAGIPSLAELQLPLTRHERLCVGLFVATVTCFMHDLIVDDASDLVRTLLAWRDRCDARQAGIQ